MSVNSTSVTVTPGQSGGAPIEAVQVVNSSSVTVDRQVVVLGDPQSGLAYATVDATLGLSVNVTHLPSNISVVSGFNAWASMPFVNLLASVQQVKGAAGVVGGYFLHNPNTGSITVNLYDAATAGAVTLGSTPAKLVITLAAGASANLEFVRGIGFTNGIQVASATTTTGNTAPTIALDGFILYA